jgi:hypothetical protein
MTQYNGPHSRLLGVVAAFGVLKLFLQSSQMNALGLITLSFSSAAISTKWSERGRLFKLNRHF